MRMRSTKVILATLAFALLSTTGCEEKFDLSTLPRQGSTTLDTAYIQLFPPFGGFMSEIVGLDTLGPQDVIVGNDELIYVADTRANRLVMINVAGTVLSSRSILHPISLAQDSRLDLLVGGEVVLANGDTTGAIFRIHLVSASPDSAHRLEVARIDTLWRELARPARRFPGITVLPNNDWLAVRTGPDNSSFIDPDARVLMFNRSDAFITPLPELATRAGSGITDINQPTAIASFPGVRDFILTQSITGVAYGALWMRFESNPNFEGWVPRYDPANPVDRPVDFIRPNRYLDPEAVAIDRARRDVFIADAGLDSVFKFNSRGAFKVESFGRVKTDGLMRRPTGLAFSNRTLYVLDAYRGTILRYMLTTDVPR
jgi:hypothetical protein